MPAPPSRARAGAALVLGLVLLGGLGAWVARRYRVPGTVPRMRMFPADAEAAEARRVATLPPGKRVPPRLAARVLVEEEGNDRPAEGAAFRAAGPIAIAGTRALGGGVLLLDFGTPRDAAPATVPVEVSFAGRAASVLRVPVAISCREDALDAPLQRIAVP